MKLLTYNCGLLKFQTCGMTPLFENPPFVRERYPHLAKALLDSGTDIIVLQEIYDVKHIKKLVDDLKSTYPYSYYKNTGKGLRFTNGLMTFSKYPIKNANIVKHFHVDSVDYFLGSRCMQVVELTTPTGLLQIINLHTSAGLNPEKINRIRGTQVDQAIDVSQKFLKENNTSHSIMDAAASIITGDFNAGPEASIENYEIMLKQGYVDAVKEVLGVDKSKKFFTWDHFNFLNDGGIHEHCVSQRIDHVFYNTKFKAASIEYFQKEAFIPVKVKNKKGKKQEVNLTLSDHYGVIVELVC